MNVTRGAEGYNRRAFSVDEVWRMLEIGILDSEDRFELIEGEIVPMVSPDAADFILRSRLGGWFGRTLDDKFDVGMAGSVQLGPYALFEPDVVILPRQKLVKHTFIQIDQALLIIEVADASFARDMGIKAKAYAHAGLPELWVVDLNARVTHVHREPSEEGYGATQTVSFDAPLSASAFAMPELRITELED